jgi:hypothetical protein
MDQPLTWRALWRQFLPLSLSDVTMAATEPLVATTLAHLPQARVSLAALGVAKAIAIFLESPIIMVLHASNALAASTASHRALWRFVKLACGGLTVAMALMLLPPIFTPFAARVMGVPAEVAYWAWWALALLACWPASIGWRRFYQGLLIARGFGGPVGRAGIGRLLVVALGLLVGLGLGAPGTVVGAGALAAGVLAEAVFVTVAAARRGLLHGARGEATGLPTDLPGVWRYYRPLASSMLVVWGGRAALIALVARSLDAPIALAAWPAAWSLVSVISNATRMVQQITIRYAAGVPPRTLLGFAASVGAVCGALLLLLALLGQLALGAFLAGDPVLVDNARPVLFVCSLVPLEIALQNCYQGLLIARGVTRAVSLGAWVGTGVTLAACALGVFGGLPGAAAAAIAMAGGYAAELATLALAFRVWARVR